MKNVHFIVQQKGGAGKSNVAALLAEHIINTKDGVTVIDTDGSNQTMLRYGALKAVHVDYKDEMSNVDKQKFDALLAIIENSPHDVVIDTGSNTIDSLVPYLISNFVFEVIQEMDCMPVLNIVIAGGKDQTDCLKSARFMLESFGNEPAYAFWLNEFFGAVGQETLDFVKSISMDGSLSFGGFVKLPIFDQSYAEDLANRQRHGLLFSECQTSPMFPSRIQKKRMEKAAEALFLTIGTGLKV